MDRSRRQCDSILLKLCGVTPRLLINVITYKCIDRMPLLEIAEDVDEDEDEFENEYCKETDEDEGEGAHAEDEGADAGDQEGAEGESGDQDYEAEEILDCIVHSDDSVEYLVKFKNYGKAEWIAAENTVGCKKLIRQYEAVQALKELGTGLIASGKMKVTELCAAVELNVKNEINGPNRKAVIAAILREEKEMMSRRLRMLDSVQVSQLTPTQRKEAYRLRHLLTQKRPTLEQEEANESGDYKDRIVCCDVKADNQADAVDVHMGVPDKEGLRLIVACADLAVETVSSGDFKVAYLQSDEHPIGAEEIAVLRDPETMEIRFYYMDGEIYGKQPAGKKFKDSVGVKMEKAGFLEAVNIDSVYVKANAIAYIWVDDPLVWARGKTMTESIQIEGEIWKYISENFDMKGEYRRITRENPIDFLSMRMSVAANNRTLQLDNDARIRKILTDYDMLDCNPKKQPFTKCHVAAMAESQKNEEFMNEEEATQHRSFVGDCGWLAQTSDPNLAPYVSILGKYNSKPVKACIDVRKYMLQYLKSQLGLCLSPDVEATEGLRYTNDTDHAGLYGIDGDTRSRNGTLIMCKGMPVGWKSSWIKPGAKGDTAIKLSSGEAETAGAAEGLKLCKFVKHIADDLKINNTGRINMEVDATVAIAFGNNTQCVYMRDHSSKWTSLTEKLKNPSWTRAGDILVENQDLENYG